MPSALLLKDMDLQAAPFSSPLVVSQQLSNLGTKDKSYGATWASSRQAVETKFLSLTSTLPVTESPVSTLEGLIRAH